MSPNALMQRQNVQINSDMRACQPGILSFSQLRGEGGGGLFGPHPRKHSQDNLIDSKFGTANCWHKTRKSTKF